MLFNASHPCPFPAGSATFFCNAPAQRLTIVGEYFGFEPGAVAASQPVPQVAAAAPPADVPFPLTLAQLGADAAGCLAPTKYTGDGFAYTWCPFQRLDQFYAPAGSPPEFEANLGVFTALVRAPSAACASGWAATSFAYEDGTVCSSGVARTATVAPYCIDETAPNQDYYTINKQINRASANATACTTSLRIPLSAACGGVRFNLCTPLGASPTPVPVPQPALTLGAAFVAAWDDAAVTAYAMGSVPPRVVQLTSAGGGEASALVGPGPMPLPPSFSPAPNPFPRNLTVTSMSANAGPAGTPVTQQLEGVSAADVFGGGQLSVRFCTAPEPACNFTRRAGVGFPATQFGLPQNGAVRVALLDGAPAGPIGAAFRVVVVSQYTQGTGDASRSVVNRVAECAPSVCSWTWLAPGASPSASASAPPTPSGAGAAAAPPAPPRGLYVGGFYASVEIVWSLIVFATLFLLLAVGALGALFWTSFLKRLTRAPAPLPAPDWDRATATASPLMNKAAAGGVELSARAAAARAV